MDAQLLKWNDRVISVDLPKNVELQVVETDPGVKGNTQSGTQEGCSVALSCWQLRQDS
jgi:elongation factor P